MDRDNCRIQENEGPDHEAERVAGEPNLEEERELPATLEGPQEHHIEDSSSTPHLEVDLIPTRGSDIAPALSRRKRLRNCQLTPRETDKIPEVSHSDPDGSDEEVYANDSEVDNCPEVFTDADSGSYNDPVSLKSASHDWLIYVSHRYRTD